MITFFVIVAYYLITVIYMGVQIQIWETNLPKMNFDRGYLANYIRWMFWPVVLIALSVDFVIVYKLVEFFGGLL